MKNNIIKFSKINEDFWKDIFKIGRALTTQRNIDVGRFRGSKRRKIKLLLRNDLHHLVTFLQQLN